MRRKPIRTVTLAGPPFTAGGALLHQLRHAYQASATGAILASIRQWIQSTLAHTSPAQIVEVMGVAWFVFVVALLLLTRTGRAESLDREPLVHEPDEEHDVQKACITILADSAEAANTPPRRSIVNPPVPYTAAPPGLPSLHRSLLELPYTAVSYVPTNSREVSYVPTNSREVSQVNGNPPGRNDKHVNDGHLLALTRIAATERWCKPYGLFVVAERVVGPTSKSGEASRRTVAVIVSRVAPLLAHDTAHKHLSALFETTILRATYLLRQSGSRTAADVRVLVAGIMVIGTDVYVVNFGHSGACQFRPLG